MNTIQRLDTQLTNRVYTFALSEATSDLYQEANELVLRGFSRYTEKNQTINPDLKSLKGLSENYMVIVSERHRNNVNISSNQKEIFSVMSISKGSLNDAKSFLPSGNIIFSKNMNGKTQYLYEILGVRNDQVSEVGNFVCLDKNNHSLVRTSEGFEAFFNALRVASIWCYQSGVMVSTAIMKPSLHRLVSKTMGIPYEAAPLQINLDAHFPDGRSVREFVDHIPGYMKLGTPDQPLLYYMTAERFYKYMNSRWMILRAQMLSLMLKGKDLVWSSPNAV
jgi:hypothetical protein